MQGFIVTKDPEEAAKRLEALNLHDGKSGETPPAPPPSPPPSAATGTRSLTPSQLSGAPPTPPPQPPKPERILGVATDGSDAVRAAMAELFASDSEDSEECPDSMPGSVHTLEEIADTDDEGSVVEDPPHGQ